MLPFEIFADKSRVSRIVAEGRGGSFGVLPRRLDCVAALAPGILTYQVEDEAEVYLALDEGILVKIGPEVLVSVRRAQGGADLAHLRRAVQTEFLRLDAHEKSMRQVMDKLEAGLLQRMAALRHV
jgi:F-type H+-transporting ATPase subunit epsilon